MGRTKTICPIFLWYCYLTVDFEMAASQNGVCIIKKMCHRNGHVSRLLYDKRWMKVIKTNVFVIFR
jgi:hypothetical protein